MNPESMTYQANFLIFPVLKESIHWIRFDEIPSTNSWVKEHAQALDRKKLTCVLAERQTHGYGRWKRVWISPQGNLHMTLFFCLPKWDPRLPNLAQIMALAATLLIEREGIPVKIKWPNDLLIEGKKLAGVLVELITLDDTQGIALGMGMDVNTSVTTDQPTISLLQYTGKNWDIQALCEGLIETFTELLDKGFAKIWQTFQKRLAFQGKDIFCKIGNYEIKGIQRGINQEGHLLIKTPEGKTIEISSGETTNLRSTDQAS